MLQNFHRVEISFLASNLYAAFNINAVAERYIGNVFNSEYNMPDFAGIISEPITTTTTLLCPYNTPKWILVCYSIVMEPKLKVSLVYR